MPELPDVVLYVEALERFVAGRTIERARIMSVSLLRTYDPPVREIEGRRVLGFRRLGKRLVWELEEDLFMVFHLMITGRFRWRRRGTTPPRKTGHAAFDFERGTLVLTEQGSKKRSSLHIHRGREELVLHERGGIEPLEVDLAGFGEALLRENRTLKRALTDPRLFSGIGNAYSDEILHRARLSPVRLTGRLADSEVERLYHATRSCLVEWIDRLREEVGEGFPEKVTAFRPEMVVHGKFGQRCPECGEPVRRIVYASNETNYCAGCQTGGKILADRALSRVLKGGWPR